MLDSIRRGRYPNLDRVPAPNKYSVVKLVRYVLEVSPSKERCAMCEFLGQLSSSNVVNLMIF